MQKHSINIRMYDDDTLLQQLLDIDGHDDSEGLTVDYDIVAGSWTGDDTDGITDAQNGDGQFFDTEGLLEVLLSNSGRKAVEVQEDILNSVSEFVAGVQQFDDIALFVVMRRGLEHPV